MKLFPVRFKIKDPKVIMPHPENPAKMEATTRKGILYRVFPTTGMEVAALMMLEHRVDKFAPAQSDGVFITPSALAILDA